MSVPKISQLLCKRFTIESDIRTSFASIKRFQKQVETILKENLDPYDFSLSKGGSIAGVFCKKFGIKYSDIEFRLLLEHAMMEGEINFIPSSYSLLKNWDYVRKEISKLEDAEILLKILDDSKRLFEISHIKLSKKKPILNFELSFRTRPEVQTDLLELISEHGFAEELLEHYRKETRNPMVLSKGNFEFPSNKYRIVGGLPVPTKLEHGIEHFKSIGIPSISGLEISFEESPIGVYSVGILSENNLIKVEIKSGYSEKPMSNLIANSLRHSMIAAELFVEPKERKDNE